MNTAYARAGICSLAALCAGAALWSVPTPLVEIALTSSGISELVPAAAPPLGLTARAILATGAGFLGLAVALVLLPRGGAVGAEVGEDRYSSPTLFSRLLGHKRQEDAQDPESAPPIVRRADAHPDAPARSPIMASRDLGQEPLPAVLEEAAYDAFPAPSADLPMPRSPEPLAWDTIKAEMARITETMQTRDPATAPAALGAQTADVCDAEVPTIADLAHRLERGLERRRLVSPMTIVAPSEQPQAQRASADDAALHAALDTLRGLTAKAG